MKVRNVKFVNLITKHMVVLPSAKLCSSRLRYKYIKNGQNIKRYYEIPSVRSSDYGQTVSTSQRQPRVRNAGNLIPHSRHFVDEMTSCEPAGLELSCIVNDIKHVIVCGHSDCKAMNLLYKLKSADESNLEQRRISPLKSWLCAHGKSSLNKFLDVKGDFNKPILFSAETPQRKFVAYIDPENQFCIEDKLSQVNTLQQLQNIASYGMLKKRLEKHDLHIHALWFDIYTGDIYYFSRRAKRFLIIDEASYEVILAEIRRYYS
ncbi:beta carbonic anhydrase 1 isoform X1 [Danaus plexippus]|uniref:beta carbonic anhydrase 1 isoform X1 n=1 Tax=Danaus plexippus TaxID=13037 RepID=UPI002AAFE052|nr:beta carbonic anhydrase 1 isoform X1 [Danaus plexippus]